MVAKNSACLLVIAGAIPGTEAGVDLIDKQFGVDPFADCSKILEVHEHHRDHAEGIVAFLDTT
jgi:hypothetical protein